VSARIAVLDYGMGNLHSVARALDRVGADTSVIADANDVADADGLVIPGVGRFGACVRALRAAGLGDAATSFVTACRPVSPCVGMQCSSGSDEDPERGMGVLPGRPAAAARRQGPAHGMEHGLVDRTAALAAASRQHLFHFCTRSPRVTTGPA
jgi:glutamine amidotransferase